MRRYQSGDDDAFTELEQRYNDRLTGYFFRRFSLRNHFDARELACETWEKVFRSRYKYEPSRASFRAWIFGIARHVGIDAAHYKEKLQEHSIEDEEALLSTHLDNGAGQNRNSGSETVFITKIAVERALLKLSEAEREIILLHDYEGLTFTEIGQHLGCKPESAKSRYRRARPKLCKLVSTDACTKKDGGCCEHNV